MQVRVGLDRHDLPDRLAQVQHRALLSFTRAMSGFTRSGGGRSGRARPSSSEDFVADRRARPDDAGARRGHGSSARSRLCATHSRVMIQTEVRHLQRRLEATGLLQLEFHRLRTFSILLLLQSLSRTMMPPGSRNRPAGRSPSPLGLVLTRVSSSQPPTSSRHSGRCSRRSRRAPRSG